MAKASHKIELEAQPRTVSGRAVRTLRNQGVLPAVLYGKGQEAISLQMPLKDFQKVLKSAGESTLVYVNINGQSHPTIIHDVSRDAVRDFPLHADFYKVRLDEKIKAQVPVAFIGVSPAVAEQGAIFVRNINEMEVEAFPQDLPHEINIDISKLLNIGDQILLKDIVIGAEVKLIGEPDEIIATAQAPKSEAELEAELAAPTTDVSAVEEIKKEAVEGEEVAEGEEAPATAQAAPDDKKPEKKADKPEKK